MPKTGISARDPFNLAPQIGYVTGDINLATVNATALAAGLQFATLPAGALVMTATVIVVTVLAGGTPALKFGTTTATATELVANAAYSSVATTHAVPNTAATFSLPLAVDTPLYAKETGVATSGRVIIIVEYVKIA